LGLGTAYFINGETLLAIKTFEKALKIDPLNLSIHKTLENLGIKFKKK